MLKGLLTAGHFVPAAGPSQAVAVTRCAPKAAHCPKLSLSLPSLHWRTCPCCAGITASIALVSLPSTRWRHCPSFAHCLCLASSVCPVTRQSRHALASLLAPRHCCCRRSAGIIACVTWVIVALVALVLPTLVYLRCASITNWHLPSHDAFATHCRGGIVVALIIARYLATVPGIGPQQLGRWRSGQGSNVVVAWPSAAS
jgi:hypothetical protein